MGKRISKRVRSHAARLCSIAACNQTGFGTYLAESLPSIERAPSHDAAWDAWDEACKRTRDDNDRTSEQVWAEAEALLRTGWTP